MKKRLFGKFLLVNLLFLLGITNIYAHPGKTDSSGCHTCRTNCEKWGLQTGEYHCHNSWGSSSSGNSNSSSNSNSNTIPKTTTPSVDYTAKGNKDGYDYKRNNPNAVIPNLEGQNEAYVNAYQESFHRACEELTTESENLAITNATNDARTIESMNLEINSSQVINDVYLEKYKEIYNEQEQLYFKEISTEAKSKADMAVWNKEDKDNTSSYELKKANTYYKEKYDQYYKEQNEKIKEIKKELEELAKETAKDGKDKDYQLINVYEEYKIYDELKGIYDKIYQEELDNNKSNPIYGIIGVIVIAGLGYLGFKKYKKKKI